MSFYLRLLGITNAALWFGATAFVVLGAGPAFSSPAMLQILPPSHSGAAAQVLVRHFSVLQYWCGGIALVQLLVSWLYTGTTWKRWSLYLVLGLFALGLLDGQIVQPRLQRMHLELYGRLSTPQQRENAALSSRRWQRAAQASHVAGMLGVWLYLLEISRAGALPRVPRRQIQGLTNSVS